MLHCLKNSNFSITRCWNYTLKSLSSVLLISRYILGLGQCGRCCFCAACLNHKMCLEIRSANEGAFRLLVIFWFSLHLISLQISPDKCGIANFVFHTGWFCGKKNFTWTSGCTTLAQPLSTLIFCCTPISNVRMCADVRSLGYTGVLSLIKQENRQILTKWVA